MSWKRVRRARLLGDVAGVAEGVAAGSRGAVRIAAAGGLFERPVHALALAAGPSRVATPSIRPLEVARR